MESEIVRIARRGVEEDDVKWFSKEAVQTMKKAQVEIQWLLDRGYKLSSIMEMIGGHYQFSARQRSALQRGTASSKSCQLRKEKLLPIETARKDEIYIDGFNLIITIEVALSGGTLIRGNDGTIRDLAGLRGTYKVIDKTYIALKLIGKIFADLNVPAAKIFLDSPVSNSGKLKTLIGKLSKDWSTKLEVELVSDADVILSDMDRIITSDSIILDRCFSWFNLCPPIIESYLPEVKIVNLTH